MRNLHQQWAAEMGRAMRLADKRARSAALRRILSRYSPIEDVSISPWHRQQVLGLIAWSEDDRGRRATARKLDARRLTVEAFEALYWVIALRGTASLRPRGRADRILLQACDALILALRGRLRMPAPRRRTSRAPLRSRA